MNALVADVKTPLIGVLNVVRKDTYKETARKILGIRETTKGCLLGATVTPVNGKAPEYCCNGQDRSVNH